MLRGEHQYDPVMLPNQPLSPDPELLLSLPISSIRSLKSSGEKQQQQQQTGELTHSLTLICCEHHPVYVMICIESFAMLASELLSFTQWFSLQSYDSVNIVAPAGAATIQSLAEMSLHQPLAFQGFVVRI